MPKYIHLILSFLCFTLSGAVSVVYPIQSQLPLVARVGVPYSWSISTQTFSGTDQDQIQISKAPTWLSLSNFTLSGTPLLEDKGNTQVVIAAGGSRVCDNFTLVVTDNAIPVISIPLQSQFIPSNSAFSSVYVLHNGSALASSAPAVRVPPNWSFSIGFEGGTFSPAGSGINNYHILYSVLLGDGTPLPSWLTFNTSTFTLFGVTPSPAFDPERFSLNLIGSDISGSSAIFAPFDIIIASHELSISSSTIGVANITTGDSFNYSLGDSSWFLENISIDDRSILSSEIEHLQLDTSQYSWLKFDPVQLSLSGSSPTSPSSYQLPFSLSAYNQSTTATAIVEVVPSYFTSQAVQPLLVRPGDSVTLSLQSSITSNSFYHGHHVDLNLTCNPAEASNFLKLAEVGCGSDGLCVAGTIPNSVSYSAVNFTIAAMDQNTRAVSHLSGIINLSPHLSLAPTATTSKKRVALALGITFGLLGGLVFLFCFLALCRKLSTSREPVFETSLSEKVHMQNERDHGYGWSEKVGLGLVDAKGVTTGNQAIPVEQLKSPGNLSSLQASYTHLGLGRTPTTIRKADFFQNVKTTIRNFSGSVKRRQNTKALISRPILTLSQGSMAPINTLSRPSAGMSSNMALMGSVPSADNLEPELVSLGLASTPRSNSTGGSAPHQKAGFGPPRKSVPRSDMHTTQPPTNVMTSTPSAESHTTGSSGDLDDAVIATANRTPSIRSTASNFSYSVTGGNVPTRPKLVQFTSANKVPSPVPGLPASLRVNNGSGSGPRRTSYVAQVFTTNDKRAEAPGAVDEALRDGIQFVRALGDPNDVNSRARLLQERSVHVSPSIPPSVKSAQSASSRPFGPSRSSYVYPSPSASAASTPIASSSTFGSRILVRTGEVFKFRVPLDAMSGVTARDLTVRSLSESGKMPSFVAWRYKEASSHRGEELEFHGVPKIQDVGDVILGFFNSGNRCVGRLVIEVVRKGDRW